MNRKLPIAVFVSGNGSNLQAIIDQCQNVEIKVVVSNNMAAYAGQRATAAHIPYIVDVPKSHEVGDFSHKYDERLSTYIETHEAQLIVLAGFMRILSPWFVQRYRNQIINIHPSLLPKYKGLHTHQKVIDNKDPVHGITIHYVTVELDSGPIILQRQFDVVINDDPDSLEERIHRLEHQWYPTVIDVIAAERTLEAPKVEFKFPFL